MDEGLLLDYVTSTYWRSVDLHYDAILDRRQIACTLCGHTAPRSGYVRHVSECQFNGGTLERYACPACGLVFGPVKVLDLTAAQLTMEYRALYSRYREADSTDIELRAFHACRPRRDGIYLNWGSGAWSQTIDRLRVDGWDVWGYEPFAPSQSGFVVNHRGEISGRFDGIFSNNLVEHLPDPVAEFRAMAAHLADRGVMAHASPCYQLRYEDTRFHLAFYLGRSLEVLAERSGLRLAGRETDGEYDCVLFSR